MGSPSGRFNMSAIVTDYINDLPVNEIARRHGCHYTYPAKLAKRMKLDIRLPGGRRKHARQES